MMHGVRGFVRFAHLDGLIPNYPAGYARLPRIHQDESRTQGLDRLELIRFLQVAQILARHADPRTTEHYDRARGNLDRHGVHFVTAYVAGV